MARMAACCARWRQPIPNRLDLQSLGADDALAEIIERGLDEGFHAREFSVASGAGWGDVVIAAVRPDVWRRLLGVLEEQDGK